MQIKWSGGESFSIYDTLCPEMVYIIEGHGCSIIWKFNWRQRDLIPGPPKYKYNMLPTELSWLYLNSNLLNMKVNQFSISHSNVDLFFTVSEIKVVISSMEDARNELWAKLRIKSKIFLELWPPFFGLPIRPELPYLPTAQTDSFVLELSYAPSICWVQITPNTEKLSLIKWLQGLRLNHRT